ncbi:voltage-dependent anion-selective channel-like [Planococcus citri]|uniref:voltage-dependent anion-selective channel-like n=1 Tax=Planococcus citri TaxID=170843 RepID=UPI0031F7DC6F
MTSNVSPPPFYDDLGKSVEDLFSKGYNFDTVKLDVKTTAPTGTKYNHSVTSHIDSGKFLGTAQATTRFEKYGINNTMRWNTSNIMGTELSWDYLKNAKISLESTYPVRNPINRFWNLKTEYRNNRLALRTDVDCKTATISASGVFRIQDGWFVGLLSKFDTKGSNTLKSTKLALGYHSKEFAVHGIISDEEFFNCHLYHQVNPSLETGVEISSPKENIDPKFGICCKYDWDRDTAVRAKVDNSSQIGLSFTHKIKDGITITLSALINGKNFNQGGHKIGLGIEFEPYCSHASLSTS